MLTSTSNRIIWLAPDRFDVKPDKSTWLEMSACLRELGWQVTILAARKDHERESDDSFRGLVTWVGAIDHPFLFRISLLRSMVRWLAANAARDDIIMINEDALWVLPHIRRLGFQFVHLDFRTLPVNRHRWKRRLDWLLFWKIAIWRFGAGADGYSFITERLRKVVEAEFSLGIVDYAIWQSGVNLKRFSPSANGTARPDNRFRLFYHGSISRKRGLGLVIDAIALGDLPPNFEFVIVGSGPDEDELKEQAKDRGVDGQVCFRGFVPYERVVDEIIDADICICPLPNHLEWNVSSPLKIFEYMACAKPMILTPIPAHTDALGSEPFVVWTHGFEPSDFRNAILDAIQHRDSLASAAAVAPSVVKGRYEWRTQAELLDRYLTSKRSCTNNLTKTLSLHQSGEHP